MSSKNPCECCSSPLVSRHAQVKGVKRWVCDQCLGFIYRWILDIDASREASPMALLPDSADAGKRGGR